MHKRFVVMHPDYGLYLGRSDAGEYVWSNFNISGQFIVPTFRLIFESAPFYIGCVTVIVKTAHEDFATAPELRRSRDIPEAFILPLCTNQLLFLAGVSTVKRGKQGEKHA